MPAIYKANNNNNSQTPVLQTKNIDEWTLTEA